MYAILISMALAAYSMILVDFSMLFQDMSVNADMITSTQALYTAEGAVEKSFLLSSSANSVDRNIQFAIEKANTANDKNSAFLSYNEGTDSFYIGRKMDMNEADQNTADALNTNNRIVKDNTYQTADGSLDGGMIYGLEASKARSFVLREINMDQNFNDISFSYNQSNENSDILFEIFVFPRENSDIDFLNFDSIKNGFSQSVKKIVINTKDASMNGRSFDTGSLPLTVNFGGSNGSYNNQLRISGFQPINNNYILHFQTVDNGAIHYRINALYNNEVVMLPNLMQTVDVIGATPTGLYQRVKIQRQSEEGILPGLNFVLFSNGPINK
jgi:hypothetical protein